ncbi:MAG: hypothetical protein RIR11_1937 [Bacteroidota bacterium]|jgi:hypothetical protein
MLQLRIYLGQNGILVSGRLSVLAVVLMAACLGFLNAQNRIKPEQVLALAFKDAEVVAAQNNADFQRQINAKLPFLDQISLRTQTRRSDIYQQDYQTRISVNGLKEQSAFRKMQASEIAVVEANKLERLHYALYDRYLQLVDYYALAKEIPLQEALLLVYLDKIKLLENMAIYAVDTDPEALMKAEFDRDELELRIRENKLVVSAKSVLFSNAPNSEVDTLGWVSLSQMSQILMLADTVSHPSGQEEMAKIARINAESELEKARGTQILDFFQLRYMNRPGEPFRNDYSIGAGFNIPYNGSRNARRTLLRIEQYAAEQDLQTLQVQLREAIQKSKLQFFNAQTLHSTVLSQIQKAGERYNLKEVAAADKDGIQTVLLNNEFQIRRQLKLINSEKEMTEKYLQVLFLSGRMSESPLVNFLSGTKNAISAN